MINESKIWIISKRFLILLVILVIVNLFLFYKYFHKPHLFDNCQQAHKIGVTNIPKDSPLYRNSLDENNNEVACES